MSKFLKTVNRRGIAFSVAIAAVFLLCAGCSTPTTGRVRDAHLLYSRNPEQRQITAVKEFGPFYERVETAAGSERVSYRPFIHTRITDGTTAAKRLEFFWPLYASNRRENALSWRFLLCFGVDDDTTDPESPYRTWLMPFWFQGHTKQGVDYAAFFPVYGTIRNIFWDRVHFVMFPLWVEYDRAGFNSRSVLWPIFSRTTGSSGSGFKVFPLYGQMERPGKEKTRFVMWPFWTSGTYTDPSPGKSWMLFPIVGRVDRASESAWMVLPPFFSVAHGRGKMDDYRKINCPWPFVRILDQKDDHKRVFWPFWGRFYNDSGKLDKCWVLWPFYSSRFAERAGMQERSRSVFPVYYHSESLADTNQDEVYETEIEAFTRVWPLYSNRADETNSFTRIPDLTFSKRNSVLDRNLLGMFTLYTRGETTEPRQIDHSVLWGMLRRGYGDRRTDTRVWPLYSAKHDASGWYWSFLGGLLGREGKGTASSWRYLWFFGGIDEDYRSGEGIE